MDYSKFKVLLTMLCSETSQMSPWVFQVHVSNSRKYFHCSLFWALTQMVDAYVVSDWILFMDNSTNILWKCLKLVNIFFQIWVSLTALVNFLKLSFFFDVIIFVYCDMFSPLLCSKKKSFRHWVLLSCKTFQGDLYLDFTVSSNFQWMVTKLEENYICTYTLLMFYTVTGL